jgi:hypothetical protein
VIVQTLHDITIEEDNGSIFLPKGSGIHVESQDDKYYYGQWCSMFGSMKVKVDKNEVKEYGY